MSDDFHISKVMKRTIEPHECEQCGTIIPPGSATLYSTGRYEGEFYSHHQHLECHEAAHAFATLNDLWNEEYPWFQHMERAEFDLDPWLLENHPVVAERLGIERQEVEE